MANKINIGNLVTPNGASLIFGSEASNDALSLKTNHAETFNPYTIVIEEEDDGDTLPATQITYDPPADSILTATTVDEAINELADSLDDVGGAFYAIYGETPYEQIVEAYEAGKSVFLIENDGDSIYILNGYITGTLYFNSCFAIVSGAYKGAAYMEAVQLDSRGWSRAQRVSCDIVTGTIKATTSQAGIVQLSTATDSTATDFAATSSAVKAAYDLAASKGTISKVQVNGTDVASSGTANIPAASTSAYGVTKLSDATNSTSTVLAATANAVKIAYDLAASKGTGTITKVQANGTDVASSGTANIPAASTSAYGVTKLSSSTSSTSTSLAATASAVKSAYDLANAAMPKSGGTFTGAIQYNGTTTVSSTTGYYRPIRVSMAAPTASDGNIGDIWIQYS